jgi:hypothetical protein
VSVTYRGVKDELGRILATFFVALVRLVFCMFVEVVAGSGIGATGFRVLLTVAVTAAVINVGALRLGIDSEGTASGSIVLLTIAVSAAIVNFGALRIEGTGSEVLLTIAVSAAIVNIVALRIEGTGSRVLLTVADSAAIINIGVMGIEGTGSEVLRTVAVAVAIVNVGATDLLALVIAAATVGMGETGSSSGAGVAVPGIAGGAAIGSGVLATRFKELMFKRDLEMKKSFLPWLLSSTGRLLRPPSTPNISGTPFESSPKSMSSST